MSSDIIFSKEAGFVDVPCADCINHVPNAGDKGAGCKRYKNYCHVMRATCIRTRYYAQMCSIKAGVLHESIKAKAGK